MEIGFDTNLYLKLQTGKIKERIASSKGRLYLEFGGKLLDDYHASRVLPGFEIDAKIKLLKELKDDLEVIICINADNIEKKKIRADYGITYDTEVIRQIEEFRKLNIIVNSVVITMYSGQDSVNNFITKLKNININYIFHTYIEGYPHEIDKVLGEDGLSKNTYINVAKPLIVVTAPGPNSGKLATCLSQLYHESKLRKYGFLC